MLSKKIRIIIFCVCAILIVIANPLRGTAGIIMAKTAAAVSLRAIMPIHMFENQQYKKELSQLCDNSDLSYQ